MTAVGGPWTPSEEAFIGNVARVTRVESKAFYARFGNGNTVRIPLTSASSLSVDDVVLVGEQNWRKVDQRLWQEPRGVGVVRKHIDTKILVEAPGGLVLTEKAGVPASDGNTVTYSIAEGVIEVLDESPIRGRVLDERPEDLSRFEFSGSRDKLTYSSFGGYSTVVQRARQIIETQFQKRDYLREIDARPIRGILLSGPPGTGKTYLARVIASESDAAFFLVSGPSIVSKYVGDTEELLRRIFESAQNRERAIVFFDEIDSIAGERSERSNESSDRLVAQLLTEMDGFSETEGNVIVLAATNRPDRIDPALQRPGRFDWEIVFGLPTVEDRLQILEIDARRLSTSGDLPLEVIATESEGWSAARLASIWTEAALVAAADSRSSIDAEDLIEAFEFVSTEIKTEVSDDL